VNPEPSIGVITLNGELDIARKDELRSALSVTQSAHPVLIDLVGVTYADSTALSELLRFSLEAQERNVPVALLAISPQFLRVIEYARLDQALRVFTDRERALEYLHAS